MKLYVLDDGWSGATILVAKDRETANKALIDPRIEYYTKARDEHHRLYESDPSLETYGRYTFNPNTREVENLTKYRDTLLDEYEIVEGLRIETTGDN
jgi:hypothetical protein